MVRIHPDPPSPCLVWLARSLAGILCALYDWGISSAGRAPALQAGGRRFDPVILHQSSMHSVLREAEPFALAIEPVRAVCAQLSARIGCRSLTIRKK